MTEEAAAPVAADVVKPVEETTRPSDAVAEPAVAEAKPAEDGVVATEGVAEVPKDEDTKEEPAAKDNDAADAQPSSEAANGDADAPATNGTPAAKKANKAKSASDKKKTPAKGKKKAPELRLNVSAGEMYMVAMRGYQPWPVIVCDEEMLPESLLSKRPVSARRIDGTYREDFLEGGKNAKDRRYPIMFLGTNEFAWQVNTELLPFDLDEVKKDVDSGKQGKKNKALWEAYQTAAEGHDLAHFKTMLANHEEAMQQDAEQRELKEQEKAEKAAKAAKRKSTAAADSDDVEMQDAGDDTAPKKAKASKKRKKGDESDGENEKPAKTPKTKLKLTNKTPKDASAAKPKKESKSKKKSSEEAEPVPVEEPPMTEEERLQKREKQILYLRHRLQKGFLSRDQAPKDEDMLNMSDYLKQLEAHEDLEAEVIKKTKVHKVLKNIIKLNDIPKEEEYRFKERSTELLAKWGTALASDNEPATTASATGEPSTNGVKHDEDAKSVEPATEKKEDTPAESVKTGDADGDVKMADADKNTKTDTPSAPVTDAEKAPEVVVESDKTAAPTIEAATA